ncbi:MAG TPA: cysteine--tRNA ligase [Spirochaetota bacterium]|nr:cysteine--tRNA ligase [Spirochaetota bacterium]HPH01359.1 cysteine--tRNA ligase [Spirochaetota bacterium]
MAVQLYNTMTRRVEEFSPLVPGKVTMYTCGPTVYDYAHIGNFRAYIFEDLLHRVLRFAGYDVTQVMNLTDVDDKTIRNSIAKGMALDEYTGVYKQAFFEDIKALGITPAAVYPEATKHVPEMISLIRNLLDKGFAYQKEGSVYFSIERYREYGKLAHLDREGLVAGASGRVDSDEYEKDHVSDFVLWKGYSDKDGDVVWDSPFGRGRPGWHIECSAMSMKYLGETMDIHTGGIDNMFPHHENEIAQSEAASGKPFVRTWLHCAWLLVDGEKMSKSKGNFFTFRDLVSKGWSPKVIRYLLISTHYRKTLNFSEQGLEASKAALARLDTFLADVARFSGPDADGNNIPSGQAAAVGAILESMLGGFTAAIEDDLNISEAMAAVFPVLPKIREHFPLGKESADAVLRSFKRLDEVLNVLDFGSGESLDDEIEAMIAERNAARKAKNFAESDRIRDELAKKGIILKDTPQGTVWEKHT